MVKAVRGAVQFSADDKELIKDRVQYLVKKIIKENNADLKNIVSIIFSITDDLKSINPAAALRAGGDFSEIPLFSTQEPDTEGAMPRVIRVLLTCNYEDAPAEISHIYLDGAEKLRPDFK